jgi:preprotein translocase subunit SecB
MSDDSQGGDENANKSDAPQSAEAAKPTDAANAEAPSLNIIGQYIKDLSFENPNAPGSILPGAQPKIALNINVTARKQADDVYVSELTINAKAERDDAVLFSVELVYGGLFRLQNVPEAQIYPLVMVECPRMIFPFARQILTNITQAGGFPPLMMEPVDFGALLRQNLVAQQKQQAAQAAADGTAPKVN